MATRLATIAGGRTHSVPVHGGVIDARSFGCGPAVLLLHGWSMDSRVWAPQCSALSQSLRVVSFDRRGFGRSALPPALEREGDDVLAVLDALAIERCVLVGQSQGGRIALELAARVPGRVAGLVLQGAPLEQFHPQAHPEEAIPTDAFAAMAADGRLKDLKEDWLRHPLMHMHTHEAAAQVAEIVQAYEGRDLGRQPSRRVGLTADELGTVAQPSLVVTGAFDTPWRRLVADVMCYGLRNARRLEIPDAGHLCNLDQPASFNALLREFCTGTLH